MPTRSFSLEIKDIGSDGEGTFTGLASTYGNEDETGDIVCEGAFSKTLSDGNKRPLLWQHSTSTPIGLCTLQDSPVGLVLNGKLSLGVQSARDAQTLLRDGVVKGLSIGFTTIRSDVVDGVRNLKELKLWEVSLVTMPANSQAQVTSVKSQQSARNKEALRALRSFKSDILAALERS